MGDCCPCVAGWSLAGPRGIAEESAWCSAGVLAWLVLLAWLGHTSLLVLALMPHPPRCAAQDLLSCSWCCSVRSCCGTSVPGEMLMQLSHSLYTRCSSAPGAMLMSSPPPCLNGAAGSAAAAAPPPRLPCAPTSPTWLRCRWVRSTPPCTRVCSTQNPQLVACGASGRACCPQWCLAQATWYCQDLVALGTAFAGRLTC